MRRYVERDEEYLSKHFLHTVLTLDLLLWTRRDLHEKICYDLVDAMSSARFWVIEDTQHEKQD